MEVPGTFCMTPILPCPISPPTHPCQLHPHLWAPCGSHYPSRLTSRRNPHKPSLSTSLICNPMCLTPLTRQTYPSPVRPAPRLQPIPLLGPAFCNRSESPSQARLRKPLQDGRIPHRIPPFVFNSNSKPYQPYPQVHPLLVCPPPASARRICRRGGPQTRLGRQASHQHRLCVPKGRGGSG